MYEKLSFFLFQLSIYTIYFAIFTKQENEKGRSLKK